MPSPTALFARFTPYGREEAQWIANQALDAGLMGVIFNGIDAPEEALLASRTCATRKGTPTAHMRVLRTGLCRDNALF